MRLVAVVPKEDLVSLVHGLTPMTIRLDESRGRAITLNRPSSVDLVPDRGLRIRGDARIMWDVAGIPIPITVSDWSVLLVPRLVRRDTAIPALALEPVVEHLDLKSIPGFIDGRIADALRATLEAKQEKLIWNFAKTLSKHLALSPKIEPPRVFDLAAVDAGISVTENELRLAIAFEARIEKIEKIERVDEERAPVSRGPRIGAPASSRRPDRRPATPRMR